jgi:hypothetical protein
MTFIKPNKNSAFLNGIIAVLAIALTTGTIGMVALYNATVNMSHNIATARAELDVIGTQSTDLNNKIVATLGGSGLAKIAADGGLIMELKPQYLPVNQKWPIASHY